MRAMLTALRCSDKPQHFAHLDELFAFLIARAGPAAPVDD
jgi:hypothetical protein